ncbi:uncharacterized protein LOC109834436 [Asparagus officinalis]|uniref:uncharacterized protein LOC109834436 n=1 Tax=Asparagus officinalis TaxID=4686 RepID=UPI00098E3726|nr:uncharacterized protein LOC109834436 [Asparagus officinalis]
MTHNYIRDKDWMYAGHAECMQSIFINGVSAFMDFVRRHDMIQYGRLICPCKLCLNKLHQLEEEVELHIVKNGFVSDYKTWVYHGEIEGFSDADEEEQEEDNLFIDKEMEEIVEVALGNTNRTEDLPFGGGHREDNYDKYMNDARRPIYENAKHSTLSCFNGNPHSTWPVVMMVYNLSLWLSIGQLYFMMPLLINGPKSSGNNIDIYLRPLIEELRSLFIDGVETFDADTGTNFTTRAALMWTINDFPTYGMLSGWSVHSYTACPYCHLHTTSRRLPFSKKTCYCGHRCMLDENHPYRDDIIYFDGTKEKRQRPDLLFGEDILAQWNVKNNMTFGKDEKSRDNLKARRDLQAWNIRKELHPIPKADNPNQYLLTLKNYIRNRNRPEGSIMEGYLLEEVTTFCSRYLDEDIETKLNKPLVIHDGPSKKPDYNRTTLTFINKIHRFILLNIECLREVREIHKDEIRAMHSNWNEARVETHHQNNFCNWFKHYSRLPDVESILDKKLGYLATLPDAKVKYYKGFDVGGYKFEIKSIEESRTTQNCGIATIGTNDETYYGYLDNILGINYLGRAGCIYVFQCVWYDMKTGTGHPFKTIGVVDDDICDGQRKFIIRTCSIEVSKVDADVDPSILLQNWNNVHHLIGVSLLPDEA